VSRDNQLTSDENERLIPWNILLTVWGDYRRLIVGWSCGLTVVIGVIAAAYLVWFQPIRSVSTLSFRPTFVGAESGQYPNGLVFSEEDIAAQPILDIIYDSNGIAAYASCSREAFRGGFFVERWSNEGLFLQLEYGAILRDPALSVVERSDIQAAYEARRQGLPLQYRLTYVEPDGCAEIPQVVIAKSLTDVLSTWAFESEEKRGVLAVQIPILTPEVLDMEPDWLSFIRADVLRTRLLKFQANLEAVLTRPGANVIRAELDGVGFAEVHAKLTDLVVAVIEPLVAKFGGVRNQEVVFFLNERIATTEREHEAALGDGAAYKQALREYSGVAMATEADQFSARAAANTNNSDMQTLQPQIDRTFIDRLVEMTEISTTFRRDLTQQMVGHAVRAVDAERRIDYYRRLLNVIGQLDREELQIDLDDQLSRAVDQGKALITEFNNLYGELSRMSFRAEAALYQVTSPAYTQVSRSFTMGAYVTLVGGAFFAILCLAFALCLIRHLVRTSSGLVS
jgi:hypothetical protein